MHNQEPVAPFSVPAFTELVLAVPPARFERLGALAEPPPVDLDTCVHRLFEAQVRRVPGRVAVEDADGQLTYAELDARASRWARALVEQGVGPERLVAIACERSADFLAAVLAVFKAGGAYLPLDLKAPPARWRTTLEQSGCRHVLAAESLVAAVAQASEGLACVTAIDAELGRGYPELPLELRHAGSQLAYVIFTSGSTGTPKGAMVEQRGMLNHLLAKVEDLALTQDDVVVQCAPQCFDISVWQFLAPLVVGGQVLVVADDEIFPPTLTARIERAGATVLELVPSMIRLLLDTVDAAAHPFATLRFLLSTGETLQPELCSDWLRTRPGIPIVNAYGPTECSDDVTHFFAFSPPSDEDALVPVGRPIRCTELYVVNESPRGLVPCQRGEIGELIVGGLGVGRGYIRDAERTARAFFRDPFTPLPGRRLYRTGDLVRVREDGVIEHLGRADRQVKIRGHRIELQEIESALLQCAGVREAVVEVAFDAEQRKLLAAYVVARGAELAVAALRETLGQRLPPYMIPQAFCFLDTLPLSANGKVDRAALPRATLGSERAAAEQAPAAGELEAKLIALWSDVLGVHDLGRHEDFFELGGDSIHAALVVNRLQELLGEPLYVATLFRAPTVAQLAHALRYAYPEAAARIDGTGPAVASATGAPVTERDVHAFRALIQRSRAPERQAAGAARLTRPAAFVLSAPRSGSTLLRVMLGRNPAIFAPPELELLSFASLGTRKRALVGKDAFWLEGTVRCLMELRGLDAASATAWMAEQEAADLPTRDLYAQLQCELGDRLLVDKTTTYALDPRALERAEEIFEAARYVHLVRHPYAAIRSFQDAHFEQVYFRPAHAFAPRALAELVWHVCSENIARFLERVPAERRLLVHYEQLVTAPEAAVRTLCDFLGMPFDARMLQPYADRSATMTDGLHAQSRMLGDPRFHTHTHIDAALARTWRRDDDDDFLGAPARAMAASLGYALGTPVHAPSRDHPRQPYPVTPMQASFLILDELGRSPAYHCRAAVRLRPAVDERALERALARLIERHAALRTRFSWHHGQPRQEHLPSAPVDFAVCTCAGGELDPGMYAPHVEAPFDLGRDTLLRARLYRLDGGDQVLLLISPHIACDGWSLRLLMRDLLQLYAGGPQARLPPLAAHYADYVQGELAQQQAEATDTERAYWFDKLGGPIARLDLAREGHRRAELKSTRGEELAFELDAGLSERLQLVAREHKATLFMVLLAVLKLTLHARSGQRDIVVGTPTAGRYRREHEDVVGLFMNVLLLRDSVDASLGFAHVLERVRETTREAFAHQRYPFGELVHELDTEIDLSRGLMFDVMFALHNHKDVFDYETLGRACGLEIVPYPLPSTTSRSDLAFEIEVHAGSLRVRLEYDRDLFARSEIEELAASFRSTARAAAAESSGRTFAHAQNEMR